MRTSQQGIALMHYFESCKLRTYRCAAGVPTIGWGHTGPDVRVGMVITQNEADALFRKDLERVERDVNGLLRVRATQPEFDALVCLAYNIGTDIDADDIAEGLGDSTLLKMVNAGNTDAAADEFPKWNKGRVNGIKQVIPGLVTRRRAERALFLGQDWRKAL